MRFVGILILSGLIFSAAGHSQPIGEADLLNHIEILASDGFEGRQPGTLGENKTIHYIATQWAFAGLRPAGARGSWYAPVSLVERTPASFRFTFSSRSGRTALRLPQDSAILRSRDPAFDQADIPVVFAGFADPKPDGLSVAGKLVLLPRTSPEDIEQPPDFRSRKRQLTEAGALGVITVLDEADRWPRFLRYFERGSTALAGTENHAELEGLISFDLFETLARQSGLDAAKLLADKAAISIVDLGLAADARVETQVRSYMSHNVIGKVPGTDPKQGAILFMGHWDHFGICRVEDPLEPGKDRICNGAVDNASGISLLIETAKRLSGDVHDRDIYFLATTAEEKGLLGAQAFVEDTPIPLENWIAVFNADTIALSATGQRLAVIGLGATGLDADIETVANQEGRDIDRSGKSDGYLRRQDAYVFLERGIPAYMITSAFADEERLQAYLNGPYHDVSDDVNGNLLLGGATADANFHVALGRYFSSTGTYPGIATSGSADN